VVFFAHLRERNSSLKNIWHNGTNFDFPSVNTVKMKLKAVVKMDEAVAHFAVSHKGPGMYHADLVRYNGNPEQAPPSRIILIRGVRQWTGSTDNDELLNKIGREIERAVTDAPIFKVYKGGRNRGSGSPEQKENR